MGESVCTWAKTGYASKGEAQKKLDEIVGRAIDSGYKIHSQPQVIVNRMGIIAYFQFINPDEKMPLKLKPIL